MRLTNIGTCRTINEYVMKKQATLDGVEKTFRGIFPLMFSEKDNVFYEKSVGFRIDKTTYGEAYEAILLRAKVIRSFFKTE